MKRLMGMLHLPTIEDLIEGLPHVIPGRSIWYWEGFNGLMQNSLFEHYDPVLMLAVDRFYAGRARAFSYTDQYSDTPGGNADVFSSPGDMPRGGNREAAWDDILGGRVDMRGGLDAMLQRLRSAYLKVNIANTNRRAHRAYFNDQLERENRRKKAARKAGQSQVSDS